MRTRRAPIIWEHSSQSLVARPTRTKRRLNAFGLSDLTAAETVEMLVVITGMLGVSVIVVIIALLVRVLRLIRAAL